MCRFIFILVIFIFQPVYAGDLFLPFEESHERLKAFVSGKIEEKPDSYVDMGDDRYLLTIVVLPPAALELYFIDLEKGTLARITRGPTEFLGNGQIWDGTPWLLFRSKTRWPGATRVEYFVLILSPPSQDRHAELHMTNLIAVMEHATKGRCGGSYEQALRAGLQKVSFVNTYSIKDVDNDGYDDISLDVTEIDCKSGKETTYKRQYVSTNKGLLERSID